jgi:hypothetical protein
VLGLVSYWGLYFTATPLSLVMSTCSVFANVMECLVLFVDLFFPFWNLSLSMSFAVILTHFYSCDFVWTGV